VINHAAVIGPASSSVARLQRMRRAMRSYRYLAIYKRRTGVADLMTYAGELFVDSTAPQAASLWMRSAAAHKFTAFFYT